MTSLFHLHWKQNMTGFVNVTLLCATQTELAASYRFRKQIARGKNMQRLVNKPHALFLKKMHLMVRHRHQDDRNTQGGARRLQGLRDVKGWASLVHASDQPQVSACPAAYACLAD